MYCKKCKNEIHSGGRFCQFCGSKIEEINYQNHSSNINKSSRTSSIVSLVLFVISLFPLCFFLYGFVINPAVMGVMIVILLFPAISLIIASAILAINSMKKIPKNNNKILYSINKIQLIISSLIILSIIPVLIILGNSHKTIVKKELNNLYYDNYEIIDDSRCANAGGDNEYTTIIKIKDKNLYSLFHYDMVTRTFYDTTNGILKGNEILLDNYFNKDYVSLVYFNDIGYEDDYMNYLNIRVIITYYDYSIDELANIIKQLQDDLKMNYGSIDLEIYFTDIINIEKLDEYKLYLVSELAYCSYGFEKINNQGLVDRNSYFRNYDDIESIKSELYSILR